LSELLTHPPDWKTVTRDRRWWLAATPILALGFAVADLVLGVEGRLEFILLVGGVLVLPFGVMAGLRRGFTAGPANRSEAWIFRTGAIAAGVAGLWLMAFGETLVPWWIVVAPAAIFQWLFIWLKAGLEPTAEHIARVFD
jgi:hypothetical protein